MLKSRLRDVFKPTMNNYDQFASDPQVKSGALNACHSIVTGKKEYGRHWFIRPVR